MSKRTLHVPLRHGEEETKATSTHLKDHASRKARPDLNIHVDLYTLLGAPYGAVTHMHCFLS